MNKIKLLSLTAGSLLVLGASIAIYNVAQARPNASFLSKMAAQATATMSPAVHAAHHDDSATPVTTTVPTTTSMMSGAMPMNMPGMMSGTMPNMQGMMANMQDMMTGMQGMIDHMRSMQGMMSAGDMMTGTMPSPEAMQGMMTNMQAMMANMQGMMGSSGMMSSTMSNMNAMGDMQGMSHMQAISSAGVTTATLAESKPLAFKTVNGVKVFELTATPVRWPILKDVYVTAWTYNGTVPGPMIRVTEGDKVRVIVKNNLPEDTSIHWHGLMVPNTMDGVPPFTQKPIAPGQTFTYEFTVNQAGTFMYHAHVSTDKQIPLGLYAPLIVDPKTPAATKPAVDETLMLSEWTINAQGETVPTMPMAGAEPNYFTINGKAFPDTKGIKVKVGDVVRLRVAAIGQFSHPMHLHGSSFKVVAVDGNPVPEAAQLTRDTITVNLGERYDIEFKATMPGTWILHCHILHHVTNNNVEPGGLIYAITVE
jgi:hypothetical protein